MIDPCFPPVAFLLFVLLFSNSRYPSFLCVFLLTGRSACLGYICLSLAPSLRRIKLA
jgi:hypothetical protein